MKDRKRAERRRMPRRPRPLPNAATEYESPYSRVPDTIRVSFEDGTTAVYERKTDQPAPILYESIRIIRKWKGYMPHELRVGGDT